MCCEQNLTLSYPAPLKIQDSPAGLAVDVVAIALDGHRTVANTSGPRLNSTGVCTVAIIPKMVRRQLDHIGNEKNKACNATDRPADVARTSL